MNVYEQQGAFLSEIQLQRIKRGEPLGYALFHPAKPQLTQWRLNFLEEHQIASYHALYRPPMYYGDNTQLFVACGATSALEETFKILGEDIYLPNIIPFADDTSVRSLGLLTGECSPQAYHLLTTITALYTTSTPPLCHILKSEVNTRVEDCRHTGKKTWQEFALHLGGGASTLDALRATFRGAKKHLWYCPSLSLTTLPHKETTPLSSEAQTLRLCRFLEDALARASPDDVQQVLYAFYQSMESLHARHPNLLKAVEQRLIAEKG